MLSSLPQLYFPFRNSTNFTKINTPETNQNALIAKVNEKRAKKNIKNSQTDKKGNKLLKIKKYLLKALLMSFHSTMTADAKILRAGIKEIINTLRLSRKTPTMQGVYFSPVLSH